MALEVRPARGEVVADIITGRSQGNLDQGVTINGTTIESLGVDVDRELAIFSVRTTTRRDGGLPQINAAAVMLPLRIDSTLNPHDVQVGSLKLDEISEADMPQVRELFAGLNTQPQEGQDNPHVVSATPFGVTIDTRGVHLPVKAFEKRATADPKDVETARRLVEAGAVYYQDGPFQEAFTRLQKVLS